MKMNIRIVVLFIALISGFSFCLASVAQTASAVADFVLDSKLYGDPKMDIVLTEIERRPRSSVLDIKVNKIGSSVGSSFFLLCSIRKLAQQRGDYHYIVKLEGKPQHGQMIVGFLHSSSDHLSILGAEFAHLDAKKDVMGLDQFAEICTSMK